ncbi:serine/threonine protein kinase [Planctomycetota bacterium]
MNFSESPSSNKEDIPKSSIPSERPFPDFEGYQIIEELPRGGQAFVYKAIHKATKVKVALKVLAPGSLASAKARRRFEREVDLISGMKHPYIVSIRDSGIAKGQYYFAMEYLQGLPLDQYVSVQRLSFQEILELFAKICEAITFAHRHGVIHRDLKPSNIIVDKRGDPHILDLGLAKAAGSLSDTISMVSMTGEIQGTLAYMSPEQASGQVDLIDTRTDVYSMGVILYLLLTGQFPYDVSGTTALILRNIECAEPMRPKNIISKFNSEVEAILLRALEKNPNERYQSAVEFSDDIQRWLQGMPIMAKSVSSLYLLRKIVARHRASCSVTGLVIVIIIAFSCITINSYRTAKLALLEKEALVSDLNSRLDEARLLNFVTFLQAWQNDDFSWGALIATFIQAEKNTKEQKAIHFLCEEGESAEKVDKFRQQIGIAHAVFANFVIGEYYLKKQNVPEAQMAFNFSLQTIPSQEPTRTQTWIQGWVKKRLDQIKEGKHE